MKIANEDAVVEEWRVMLAIALDGDSPFAGMVDISGLLKLPLPTQRRIHEAMTPEQRDQMRKLYGAETSQT